MAPNIFYLGAANVVRIGDLRIAGLSGIWKGYNYNKAHFERLPYDENEIKSLYHVREIDVRKLLLLRSQVDIGISHDWPRGIEWQGDHRTLFKQKDQFEAEAKAGTLGSAAARYVMDRLRPAHWFSAHLHCKFAATVDYGQKIEPGHRHVPVTNGKANQNNGTTNADEIEIDLEDDGEAADQVTDPKPPGPVKNNDEMISTWTTTIPLSQHAPQPSSPNPLQSPTPSPPTSAPNSPPHSPDPSPHHEIDLNHSLHHLASRTSAPNSSPSTNVSRTANSSKSSPSTLSPHPRPHHPSAYPTTLNGSPSSAPSPLTTLTSPTLRI